MSRNGYLQKQAKTQQNWLDVGEEMGMQKMWDYVQLALRDPDVMGKDTLGKERMKKIFAKLTELANEYHTAFTVDPEADYWQEQLDRRLREVWGDELQTFYERYPLCEENGLQPNEEGVAIMTDQELIKVLRCCQKSVSCLSCEALEACYGIESVLGQAGDRLEELLKSNGRLKKQLDELELELIAKEELIKELEIHLEASIAVGKEMEAERDHFRDLTKKMWCEKQYGEDTNVPTSTEGVE